MTHLEIAIRQRFASMKLADDAVTRHWLEYALGTNERAAAVVGKLLEFVPTLAGLRFLDVGCGYGGVCIRAALAGATAVGVDVDSGLLKTAQANLADHPGVSVEFLEKNILEDAEPEASLGCFDIIVSDNVIEHVPSAERLICSIARLLAPGGLLYMTVPNARSAGQVLADCHYQTFGMSLLDSEDAKAYLASFDTGRPFGLVEYHDWAHYEATFRKYGLRPRTINAWPDLASVATLLTDAVAQVREYKQKDARLRGAPGPIQAKIETRVDNWIATAEADVAFLSKGGPRTDSWFEGILARDYLAELWYVVATRSAQE